MGCSTIGMPGPCVTVAVTGCATLTVSPVVVVTVVMAGATFVGLLF